MFKIDIRSLVIGCSYWILDVNVKILENKLLPEQYIYMGKGKTFFLFENNQGELKIDYKKHGYMPINIYDAGSVIVYNSRSRVIQIIRNVAERKIMNELMYNIPSRYIKMLEDIKPELLV